MDEDKTTTTQTSTETGDQPTEATETVETTETNATETTETPTGDVAEGASTEEGTETTTETGTDTGEQVDYKEKFGNSTKENQKLRDFLKENGFDPNTLEKTVDRTSNEYLESVVDGFDLLPQAEQERLRTAMKNADDAEWLREFRAKTEDSQRYASELSELKGKKGFERISENEDKFKEFAYQKENQGLPLEVVAKAFLFDNPAKQETAKRKGGEQPGGGSKTTQNPNGKTVMTSAEAKEFRIKSPKEYTKMVQEKKIEISD